MKTILHPSSFILALLLLALPLQAQTITTTTLDVGSGGDVGQHTSHAIVNGNPAISYYDASNSDLKYVRALDASGTSWGTPVTVASNGIVGQFTSLAVVDGNPAISYYDGTNFDLKYVRATDASGTGWDTPLAVDSTGDVGQYTSLAVVSGNPAISYYGVTNADLKFVRASDAGGTAGWGTPVTVDSVGLVGAYTSLAVVAGNAAISYYDQTNGDLKWTTVVFPDIAVAQASALTDGVSSVDFGTVIVGGSSAALTFTITNTSTGDLTNLAVSKDGANAADFAVNTSGMPTTLTAGNSTTFSVTFAPGGVVGGARGAALHIASNVSGAKNPFDIALTGTATTPEITVEQPVGTNIGDGGSKDLGTAPIGSSSAPLTFTITNTGTATLTGLAITKDGANAADFTVGTLSATSIPPGTATFTVTFTAGGVVSSTRTAAVHIASNDLDENPFDITLTGQALSFTTDTDLDGLNDASEFQMAALGFDWQAGQTALVNTLNNGANAANLFLPSQVQALRIDTPLIQKNAGPGAFTLTIGVEKSTTLAPLSFTPFSMLTAPGATTTINGTGKLEFQFTSPDNAAFFQIRAQ